MGAICCGETEVKVQESERRRRENLQDYDTNPDFRARARATDDTASTDDGAFTSGGGVQYSQRALPHEASSASNSLPPSPPRMHSQGRLNVDGLVGLEPLEAGMGSGQLSSQSSVGGPASSSSPSPTGAKKTQESASSPASASGSPNGGVHSPAADPDAAARFLAYVNGSKSHIVARTIFELWCIFVSEIDKADDAAVLGDGFGTGAGGAPSAVGGANYGDASVKMERGSTKVEKWATMHASEAVTHESVDELAKLFMAYLRNDLKARGWGGSFSFDLQGYDVTGLLTVQIKTVRKVGEPHIFEISCNYHAVSLL